MWRIEKDANNLPCEAKLLQKTPSQTEAYPITIIIPDLHLGPELGDIFEFLDQQKHKARLNHFVHTLKRFRKNKAQELHVIQMGDLYDFYRDLPGCSFENDCSKIESKYETVIHSLGELETKVSIGNHDADFVNYPSYLKNKGLFADVGHCLSGAVFRHGIPEVKSDPEGRAILELAEEVKRLSSATRKNVNIVERAEDNSLSSPDPKSIEDLPWPAQSSDLPEHWTAPWVARNGANDRALEACQFATKQGASRPWIAFVGHSHRPGISCGKRDDSTTIPVVDVGSWTYGRAEFAIMADDGIGLARLD